MPGDSRRAWGAILGVIVFLVGIFLILFTFQQAWILFERPPQDVLVIQEDEPIDLQKSGNQLLATIFRILILIVMAVIGSLLANRGIKMFGETPAEIVKPKEEPREG